MRLEGSAAQQIALLPRFGQGRTGGNRPVDLRPLRQPLTFRNLDLRWQRTEHPLRGVGTLVATSGGYNMATDSGCS